MSFQPMGIYIYTFLYISRYGIGMIYHKQEKYILAEQHYQRALKINPKNSVLLCHLAVVRLHIRVFNSKNLILTHYLHVEQAAATFLNFAIFRHFLSL